MHNLKKIHQTKSKIIETLERFDLLKDRFDIARMYGTDISHQWMIDTPVIVLLDGYPVGMAESGHNTFNFHGLAYGLHTISFIPTR